jgi:hypothetical protein
METNFSFQTTKDGRVFNSWQGRQVVILKGKQAQRFTTQSPGLDADGRQLLMARMTGNFKRGNER